VGHDAFRDARHELDGAIVVDAGGHAHDRAVDRHLSQALLEFRNARLGPADPDGWPMPLRYSASNSSRVGQEGVTVPSGRSWKFVAIPGR